MRILLRDLHLASFADPSGYGEIRDAAVITDGSWIAWVGRERDLPARLDVDVDDEIGLGGGWLLPGLIDCHTHLVYAGSRADEFEARLHGATYEQIAARGGGILATMRAVRAADVDTLVAASSRRLRSLIEDGVTTVEIKSGYGLDLDSERRMLQAARRLGRDVRVVTTFLGAHATPPGFTADAWIDEIVDEILPKLAAEGLVDAVDAFCETIGFSLDQVDRLFDAAEAFGLPIKVHAEQLSYQGGARSIAGRRGLSADHLEWLCDEDVEFMAEMGTVAVLLPGAFYCLRETRLPPIDRLREAGVPMAVATDLNPGTSPVCSLLAALNLACTLFRLTPEEALAGVTRHAARALGLPDIGAVAVGFRADLTGWAIDRPADLCQHLGLRAMTLRMLGGRITHGGK